MSAIVPDPSEHSRMASSPSDPSKAQLDFLWKVHDYTNNYVRFSDTKAALVIAFASGFIASLVTHDLHHPIREARFGRPLDWQYTWVVLGAYAAFICLASAVLVAIASIVPRLRSRPPEPRNFWGWLDSAARWLRELLLPPTDTPGAPIYWGNILAYGTQPAYRAAVESMGLAEQIQSITDHLFVLAGISDRKFRLVNLSITLAVIGSSIASLLIIFSSAS